MIVVSLVAVSYTLKSSVYDLFTSSVTGPCDKYTWLLGTRAAVFARRRAPIYLATSGDVDWSDYPNISARSTCRLSAVHTNIEPISYSDHGRSTTYVPKGRHDVFLEGQVSVFDECAAERTSFIVSL